MKISLLSCYFWYNMQYDHSYLPMQYNILIQEGGKKSLDELTAKNKFLEKQRNELVQARSSFS